MRECVVRKCPTPPVGTKVQHCTVCHQDFNSGSSGDLHRVGPFPDGRRCLTPAEMRERGMALDSRGRWIERPRSEPDDN